MTMSHSVAAVLALALGSTLTAQVTGVPFMNDYTLNGLTSGSQSCTPLCFPSPVTLTMTVTTPPGAFVVVFWMNCPCNGCALPWPPNACTPAIPNGIGACATTNQSIDLNLVCTVIFNPVMTANSAGFASMTISVPLLSPGIVPCTAFSTFSTQAVVLDLCGVGGPPVGPGPFVLTQAYDVGF